MTKYAKLSEAKLKEDLFVGLQISEILQDKEFENHLISVQLVT